MTSAAVLFVDDEPKVLQGIRRTMGDHAGEWESLFATGAEQARGIMAERTVHVVVTDIAMPVMDGKALITQMYDAYPDTVVLVLSGHWTPAVSAKQVGPSVRFLGKPIAPEDLVTAIREALSEARMTGWCAPAAPKAKGTLAQPARSAPHDPTWIDLTDDES